MTDNTTMSNTPSAIDLILAERRRQIEVEGWTPQHDDYHDDGALLLAAKCYAAWHPNMAVDTPMGSLQVPEGWPWDARWWKPKDKTANLIRAGALVTAEVERLERLDPNVRQRFGRPSGTIARRLITRERRMWEGAIRLRDWIIREMEAVNG